MLRPISALSQHLWVLAREDWLVPRGMGHRGGFPSCIELAWLEDKEQFQFF
jgi:hypothetical protein